jgi:hypothetical protein
MIIRPGAIAALAVIIASAAAPASADTVRRHVFPAGVKSLAVASGVGDIEIREGAGPGLEVEVSIRGRRNGIFMRAPDVTSSDIRIERQGEQLRLSLDQKNVEGDWLIRLPASGLASVSVSLGVGDLDVRLPAGGLSVGLGVGDVEVTTPKANVGEARVSVGVGDAEIRGGAEISASRFVGAAIVSRGAGAAGLDIAIGVGDADVRLE